VEAALHEVVVRDEPVVLMAEPPVFTPLKVALEAVRGMALRKILPREKDLIVAQKANQAVGE